MIFDYNYDYRSNASNQKSAFLNDFIGAFWANLKCKDFDLMRYYTEVNRALADAIEKNILLLGVRYQVDISHDAPKFPEEYIQEHIAHMLAKEIVKSNGIPIRVIEDLKRREIIHEVTVPVIFLKPQGDKP